MGHKTEKLTLGEKCPDYRYVVYKHTSPSGKSYIGQTSNYKKRCSNHKNIKNKNVCRLFFRAIAKYGWDSFKHEILFSDLTLEEANSLEEVMIKTHNTLTPSGYNLASGGRNSTPSAEVRKAISEKNKGRRLSEATKKKMSVAKRGIPLPTEQRKVHAWRMRRINAEGRRCAVLVNTGTKRSAEAKEKMRMTAIGRRHSLETIAKMRANSTGFTAESREKIRVKMAGRKRSSATKEKMSKANLGKRHSPETLEKMKLAQKNRRIMEKLLV